jgi:tetratricopeptide (TPR) repeat protein
MAKKKIFISYTHNDEQWATWIAGILKKNYSIVIQSWDFKPGESFVHNMHQALIDSDIFISVLSEEYLKSLYCQAEWENAFTKDPVGEKASFIPVRIDNVEPKGLLASRIYIDLFGKSDEEAKEALINGVSTKNRPRNLPSFPGSKRKLKPDELPFNNLPIRNPYFTGRTEILNNVEKELESAREAAILQTQVFKGLGGVGKSELAKEYAFRHGYKYEVVWWINAESEASILQAYTDFAFKQKIVNPDEIKSDVIVDAVRYWMQHTDHNRWLFIFDNAESEGMLRKYFPVQTLSEQRHILITSRYALWKYAKSIYVEVFSEEEASDFFFKRTGLSKNKAMQNLAEVLGRLPLALEHAAAYICVNEITYNQYLELYRKYGSELLKKKYPYDEVLQTIYVTWNISIDKIGKESVRQLLNLCAFFAPESIRDKWFSDAPKFLPKPLRNYVKNELKFIDLKTELKKYSLVQIENFEEEGYKINIHRLLQQVIIETIPFPKRLVWQHRCIQILTKHVHDDFSTAESRANFLSLNPHIITVINSTQIENKQYWEIETLYTFLGMGYKESANYAQSLEWYKKALKIRKKELGKEHPDTADTIGGIAEVYYYQSKYSDALKYYKKVLSIYKKNFGKEHPDIASVYNGIATIYYKQSNYDKALEYYNMALNIREKTRGKEQYTADIYHNIALVYDEQNDYSKALKCYNKALYVTKKTLGTKHPKTAITYNGIAAVYDNQGEYDKALEYYNIALSIKKEILGEEHPSTATSYNNIAVVYSNQGNYAKALDYFKLALNIREKILGKEHPDTTTTYNNIAVVYYNLKNYTKAMKYYKKALDINEKLLGIEHPNTQTIKSNIEMLQNED